MHCYIPMSKPSKNDEELWIGDKLPIIYEAVLKFFTKGKVPYRKQSLISKQKLYIMYDTEF